MTLEQLRIFVAVAETLHFTRAAAKLNLTQPAVSAAIANLESQHGVQLFHRVGRRIEITHAGILLLAEARSILQHVGNVEVLLDELSDLRRGTLRVATSQTVGSYWLPARLHQFAQSYPGVAITLTIGNTAQVAVAVRDGTADIGVAEGWIDEPALQLAPVAGDRLVLVVAPEHPWAGRSAIDPQELTDTPWVMREEGSATRALFDQAVHKFGLDPAALRVALVLPSGEAVRAAVMAGAGAAVVSDLVVATDIRGGLLHTVELPLPVRPFYVVHHGARYQSAAARAFAMLVAGAGAT